MVPAFPRMEEISWELRVFFLKAGNIWGNHGLITTPPPTTTHTNTRADSYQRLRKSPVQMSRPASFTELFQWIPIKPWVAMELQCEASQCSVTGQDLGWVAVLCLGLVAIYIYYILIKYIYI